MYSPFNGDSPVESYSAYVPEITEIIILKRTRIKTGIGFRLYVNRESLIPVGDSVPDIRAIRDCHSGLGPDDVIGGWRCDDALD